MSTVADSVQELVAPLVAAQGLELFDLEYAGGRLVITVDRPGGADVAAITAATRTISRALDAHELVPGHYTLEVSTPGLERALRTPAHFAWAVGREVRLKLLPTVDGDRRISGVLTAFDPADPADPTSGGGTLTVVPSEVGAGPGSAAAPHTVALRDIDRARTVFHWGPGDKPVSPSRGLAPAKKHAPAPATGPADEPVAAPSDVPPSDESAEKRVTA